MENDLFVGNGTDKENEGLLTETVIGVEDKLGFAEFDIVSEFEIYYTRWILRDSFRPVIHQKQLAKPQPGRQKRWRLLFWEEEKGINCSFKNNQRIFGRFSLWRFSNV